MRIINWTKHPGDMLGEAIDFLTHGSCQHSGFLRANGMIHEAYWPHIRDRAPIELELPFAKVFKLRGITPVQEAMFETFFDHALSLRIEYSPEDLFRYLFNVPNSDEQHTFCSRYVMHTIMQICEEDKWPLIRCMDGDWVSPRDLYISNMLIPDGQLKLIQ
jgi:hypothetical protein